MILMDEEGSKIHASCVKKWFSKFQSYLKEDSPIYVKKPNVAPNTSKFKFAHPESKLTFNHDTTVKDCDNFSASAHGFDFVDFNTIISNNMEAKSFAFINIEQYLNFKEKTVIIVGTVKGIRQNIRWYYLACSNCKKSAREKSTSTDKVDGSHEVAEIVTYECTNQICKNIKISVIPRFKILLRVQDNTGTLTLTLFDQEAKKLFKYTAKELYDKNKNLGNNLDLYPMELKVVVDKKLAIIIDITSYNVDNKSNIYGITRLTENAEIIDELEKKNLIPQPANSDSFMIGSLDIVSQETKVLKTGENLTPSAIDKSTATSPIKLISTPNELKRNLATSIDLDEMDNLSTSKSTRLSPPDEQSMPLLVPNKEK
ncbi:unnamed protein product [Lactuca saligna]|uniref:Replication factor A C-terminal domain-containing protein n=1 Tax=Lactuca saligna TaxID=75948 RepID=A0AA36A0J1_LACSI|nr:unnamed protein product [Lactuca saligna]